MTKIFLIDDDSIGDLLEESILNCGHDIVRYQGASEALANVDQISKADLVILDIIMQRPPELGTSESGNRSTGMEIYRKIRAINSSIPILVFSATMDQAIIDSLNKDQHVKFISRWQDYKLTEIVNIAERMAGIPTHKTEPVIFIVHGHDDNSKLELKNYLQNILHLPEPIILHEKPSFGKTIIEKFVGREIDLLFGC